MTMAKLSYIPKVKWQMCLFAVVFATVHFGLLEAARAQTPQSVVSTHTDDFNEGSPAAKNIWDGLAAALNAGDSAAAQTLLGQLRDVDGLTANQIQALAQVENALKNVTAGAAPSRSGNIAKIAAPRDFPANWMTRHAENLAVVKRGGVDILFLGDSITDGWRWDNGGKNIWAKSFAPRHAANFGIGYDRIQGSGVFFLYHQERHCLFSFIANHSKQKLSRIISEKRPALHFILKSFSSNRP
jgi:hypothetical protein